MKFKKNKKEDVLASSLVSTEDKKNPEILETDRICTILYFQEKWMYNSLVKKCRKIAKGNEFQFNFNVLEVLLESKDKKAKIFLVFPLGIFNYPQKVTGASIFFNLIDVNNISKEIDEESKKIMNKIIPKLNSLKKLESLFNIKYLYVRDGMSIHRHPGRFGFSSTDLDMNKNNPGVVYRKSSGKGFVQVDNVMYWEDQFELITSESRYIVLKDFRGAYVINDCVAIVKKYSKLYEKYLGIEDSEFYTIGVSRILETPLGDVFKELLSKIDYDIFYKVDPSNIEEYIPIYKTSFYYDNYKNKKDNLKEKEYLYYGKEDLEKGLYFFDDEDWELYWK
ncbi:MAG: hypothetical protein KatS3mg068_1550 [Candidatus Sericytochromatia bacterium]|nr:MAG: hypothetical protein KatS3mg068_1550 [Candidatus Sericytochromatia bacterium]